MSEGDSTYDALKSDGGKSTVTAVKVEKMPKPDSAPVDTPTRISRLVSVTIDVTGKRPNRMVLPLLITLIPQGTSMGDQRLERRDRSMSEREN